MNGPVPISSITKNSDLTSIECQFPIGVPSATGCSEVRIVLFSRLVFESKVECNAEPKIG